MGSNRGSSRWLWFLLFFVIFTGSEGWAFLTMILTFVGLYYFFKAITGASNKQNQENRRYYGRTRYTSRYSASARRTTTDTGHSADQKARVNSYLLKRFYSTSKVSVAFDGGRAVLTNSGGSFRTLDQLEITVNGKVYSTVERFRNQERVLYDHMFDALLELARQSESNSQVFDAEFTPKSQETSAPAPSAASVGSRRPIRAEKFREQVNELNDAIPNPEISNSLFELTALLQQLGTLEENFPENSDKLAKLYDTYLPYLLDILRQYTKMQNVETDPHYKQNEENLKRTISHINAAISERLIPAMSESGSSNLAADMGTLEAMLKKDGMAVDNDISHVMRNTKVPAETAPAETEDEDLASLLHNKNQENEITQVLQQEGEQNKSKQS